MVLANETHDTGTQGCLPLKLWYGLRGAYVGETPIIGGSLYIACIEHYGVVIALFSYQGMSLATSN